MYEIEEKMINSGILYKNKFVSGDEITIKGSTTSKEIKVINPDKSITEVEKGDSYDSLTNLGLYKVKETTENEEKEELFSINYPVEESVTDGEKTLSSENVKKQKANELCLCGSGKKFKKCCRAKMLYEHHEYQIFLNEKCEFVYFNIEHKL